MTDLDDLVLALRTVSRSHASLVAEVNAQAASRDRLIVACYRAGLSMRQIGQITGMSPTRISQIVREVDLEDDTPIPPV